MKSKFMLLLAFLLSAQLVNAQIPNITGVRYGSVKIEGLNIFYREAGSPDKPTLLLLHGFPTSSHMFRNLMLALQDKYHLVAPDYPGYGASSMPTINEFEYTFDHLAKIVDQFAIAKGLNKYSLYVMDYGAPVGFRLAVMHPEKVQALIIQNGNAYEEGLEDFWKPFRALWKDPKNEDNINGMKKILNITATKWQYMNGVGDTTKISPDNWIIDQAGMDRPGNVDIQLALFYSYGSNPPLYPSWQAYFRKYQPPTIVMWGKNDVIFPASGATPYKRDLKNIEVHLLPTGHFALEEYGFEMAKNIDRFLDKNNIK
ncbi:alpha/beta fold hydrolase [Mucilaginibacter aquariorum]|uniref:Alpha/beta hydrolase n=1 Tax=Mucilaginibacter aquariorum TaxID=2967225 RepID=A0ABT1SXE4_9SPHI|nr:alpha/beta hydrolase [Mucilaginibacter aquariorum]MCQ6957025.1 alpha/beta hydrolase [Mucilaginibacter aquariorum]